MVQILLEANDGTNLIGTIIWMIGAARGFMAGY